MTRVKNCRNRASAKLGDNSAEKHDSSQAYFRREDWTLFRNVHTLVQKAGVPPEQIPAVVAKELVDNALDTADDCDCGLFGDNGFYVVDDGPGLPGTDDDIAALERDALRTPFSWPTYESFKSRLKLLVGWSAANDELASSEAWSIAIDRLFTALEIR